MIPLPLREAESAIDNQRVILVFTRENASIPKLRRAKLAEKSAVAKKSIHFGIARSPGFQPAAKIRTSSQKRAENPDFRKAGLGSKIPLTSITRQYFFTLIPELSIVRAIV
jgi:hypothetical protein